MLGHTAGHGPLKLVIKGSVGIVVGIIVIFMLMGIPGQLAAIGKQSAMHDPCDKEHPYVEYAVKSYGAVESVSVIWSNFVLGVLGALFKSPSTSIVLVVVLFLMGFSCTKWASEKLQDVPDLSHPTGD